MVCVQCGAKTHVSNSRLQRRNNQVWRRRHCLACGAVYTTEEAVQYGDVWAVQSQNGSLQPFSREKLWLSLYKSCEHRQTALEDATALCDTVLRKLMPLGENGRLGINTIVQVSQIALNRFDKSASVYYQARHHT